VIFERLARARVGLPPSKELTNPCLVRQPETFDRAPGRERRLEPLERAPTSGLDTPVCLRREARARPRVDTRGERGVTKLVVRDRREERAQLGGGSELRLPHSDEHAEGLANTTLYGVFGRERLEVACGADGRGRTRCRGPVLLGERGRHAGVKDLVSARLAARTNEGGGRAERLEVASEQHEGVHGRGFVERHPCQVAAHGCGRRSGALFEAYVATTVDRARPDASHRIAHQLARARAADLRAKFELFDPIRETGVEVARELDQRLRVARNAGIVRLSSAARPRDVAGIDRRVRRVGRDGAAARCDGRQRGGEDGHDHAAESTAKAARVKAGAHELPQK